MQHPTQSSKLQQFSELVHRIYAASAEPSRWLDAVAGVAQSLQASHALLFTPFVPPARGGLLFPWQISEQHLSLWGSRYIDHDIWAQSAERKGLWREGAVLTDTDMVPQDVFRASVFYQEFLCHIGIARVCVGVVFGGAPGLPATSLSVFRGADAPAFSAENRQWMGLLVPHLSRALGLMQRLSLARHQAQSLSAALDRLTVGVFLLNNDFTVMHSNGAAKQVLARDDGLSFDARGVLSGLGFQRSDGLRLDRWLARLVETPIHLHSSFDDTFEVVRQSGKARYSVQCCLLEPDDPLCRGEVMRYVVFVTDPDRSELPSPALLQHQLGLTPAEARVTHALVQGMSYRAAAAALAVSETTVSSHVKAIYAKTHIHSKASLTRLVLSLGKAVA